MKYTPEEWVETTDGEANFYGIATKKNWVLRIEQNGELTLAEQRANINLVLAAKDMLEALKTLVDDAKDRGETKDDEGKVFADWQAAIKAIDKAEGITKK